MTTREYYSLTAADLADPEKAANQINQILSHLSDRLDQLEGIRGTATIQSPLEVKDTSENLIHSMGS